MDRFPLPIAQGMRNSGAMTTCVPVQFDNGVWETAVFFEVGGKECKDDRRTLRKLNSTLPISVEADIINHTKTGLVLNVYQL